MTFVLTATKVLNILSKTLKDAVSGFFEFYSLREGGGLLKRICRSNPIYHFPIIGETTYTLKGVMSAIGKGRCWTLEFLARNNVRNWCVGGHYLHSKADVDLAWQKESPIWSEWVSIMQVSCLYGLDLQEVIRNVAAGRIRVRQGQREQLVSLKDVKRLWKAQGE